jgi:hypothetical protein
VTAAGYAATEASVREGASGPEPLRVVLRWTAAIRMRLIDEDGVPLPEVLIERSGTLIVPRLEDGRVVLREQTSPGTFVVRAGEARAAYVSWIGPGPEIDLGDVRVAKLQPTRVFLGWSDGASADDVSISPGVYSVTPMPCSFDAATGTAELQLGAGMWPVLVRAMRPARDDSALPRGTRDLAVVTVDLRAGEDRRITLVPAPILVVSAKAEDGTQLSIPRGLRMFIGDRGTSSGTLEGDRVAVPLVGEFPMAIRFEIPGHAPAVVQLDAAPADRVHRDVVFVPAKK